MDPSGLDVERLRRYLDVLATPARLRLLAHLRVPRTAAEVDLPAGDDRGGQMRAERPLSRTTIIHHLNVLESEQLVLKDDATGRYVLNRARLFLVTDALAQLARLEPVVAVEPSETIRRDTRPPPAPTLGRRLLHVGGPHDGHAHPLDGPGPWTLGRAPDAELRIDYDPQVSRRHARLALRAGVITLTALREATNPLRLDGVALLADEEMPLRPGAVIAIGATRLVYQG